MGLDDLWFGLIAVLWAAYFVLEGFDFGVGMLLPTVGRDEEDRGDMLATIGPLWDGNEVWLVVAGGATFAAFPAWYAAAFSGLYLALLLLLVFLVVRAVSFEWAERRTIHGGARSGAGPTRSRASARRCCGASRCRASSTACRSTPTAT
jgi:cytochrome bd ubiquinol oxidase subunit II